MPNNQPNKFITWLYNLLQNTKTDDYIQWIDRGAKFIIWDKKLLVEKNQLHLKTMNFNSFRRQLSLYGFNREKHTSKKPTFSHPLFRQDREELLDQIVRAKQNGMKSKFTVSSAMLASCQSQIDRISSRSQDKAQTQQMTRFFDHINSLNQFFGIGLIKFTKVLISLLNEVFPEIAKRQEDNIINAQKLLYQTHLVSPAKTVNKKEILIILINGLLSSIEKELKDKSRNTKEKEFDEKLSQLSDSNFTFGRVSTDDSFNNKQSLFMGTQARLMMSPIIKHEVQMFELDEPVKHENEDRETTSWLDLDFN